ncbi:hypothetical protein DSUL_150122 [Desulfovibrionales bacterium]
MKSTPKHYVGTKCSQCNKRMDIIAVRKYDGKWGPWLIGAGVILSLLGGLIIGVLLFMSGIYVMTAKEILSCCPDCGHFFKTCRLSQ